MKYVLLVLLSALLVISVHCKIYVDNKDYTWWCSGNCNNLIKAPTDPSLGIVLMGGGTDVDAAYIWMINRAGGGDWVVLRTSGISNKKKQL